MTFKSEEDDVVNARQLKTKDPRRGQTFSGSRSHDDTQIVSDGLSEDGTQKADKLQRVNRAPLNSDPGLNPAEQAGAEGQDPVPSTKLSIEVKGPTAASDASTETTDAANTSATADETEEQPLVSITITQDSIAAVAKAAPNAVAEIATLVLKYTSVTTRGACLTIGACAYYVTAAIKIKTGSGNNDVEGKGKLAVYARIAAMVDLSAATVADNKTIYQNCIAEPLERCTAPSDRACLETLLLEMATSIPRSYLIKCSQVIDSELALMTAAANFLKLEDAYTLARLVKDLKDFERRIKPSGGARTESTEAKEKTSRKTFNLSAATLKQAELLSDRTSLSPDNLLASMIHYCLEHSEEFLMSPEVRYYAAY